MIKQLNFAGLTVKDVAKATEFYTNRLGLKAVQEQPGEYTMFAPGGDTMFAVLSGIPDADVTQSFDAAFVVEDVDATHKAWKEAGVEMVTEPHDMPFGRTFLIRTPDGHVLRAYTPAPM